MSYYNRLKSDMVEAVRNGYKETASVLKVLLGDIQRDPNKDFSDDKVIASIKRFIKMSRDNAKHGDPKAGFEIELLSSYLPNSVSDEDIKSYLRTIDFNKLRNKMQAIGMVIKYFDSNEVDGARVKQILLEEF